MATPSAQTLQRLADETGHQPSTLEKVLRLLDLLQEIARDPELSERLVLKGGTALNVFHLGLDRLSVDIDLNYIGALDRAVMETERPAVDAALNRLLASQGYRIPLSCFFSDGRRLVVEHPSRLVKEDNRRRSSFMAVVGYGKARFASF